MIYYLQRYEEKKLSDKMNALVLEENGKLVWREHELRRVDGWYRMRIAAAGICGSDLGRGFKGGAYHYPLVMGHEFSAVVEEAPAGGKYAPGTVSMVLDVPDVSV